ncbi:cupin domain-containing protein [Rhizobium sp. KVB221]|uniref:Cupin domain-containing protein n=1 Tax=Rhizobium setariae TaxID=2801340 RepID=A0A936YME4_9HYPH|nr:cupin domain-containing protein [Rhizobium setariae]MBL0373199.1 cupin domain-containing protein [Rhizobium setariae]
MTTAADLIAALKLDRHPEGGWYVQTFKDEATFNGRARSTAIFYLLEAGERSHWHKVDAVEIWHHYAGAALELSLSADGTEARSVTLGPDILAGQTPQAIVREGEWQCARSLGDWTLVGCTVAPGFDFSGFVMAPPAWKPGA